MRRRAVGERVEEETKARARRLFCHPERFENDGLHVAAVDPDRAARDFDAVDNRVIRFGAQRGEQLRFAIHGAFEQGHVFVQRRRERMMHRIITAIVFVKLEHRKLSDPQRREHLLRNKLLAFSHFVAQRAEAGGDHVWFAGDDQDRVVFHSAGSVRHQGHDFLPQRFQERR